jgi:hypothetical protein
MRATTAAVCWAAVCLLAAAVAAPEPVIAQVRCLQLYYNSVSQGNFSDAVCSPVARRPRQSPPSCRSR